MPVCGNYLFFELPKKIVLNPKDGRSNHKCAFYSQSILAKSATVQEMKLDFRT